MAGESNQRSSWWKFKSKPAQDNDDDELENSPPARIILPRTSSSGNARPTSMMMAVANSMSGIVGNNNECATDPNQSIRDLRDRFLQNKDDDLNHNRVFGAELEKSLDVAAAKISVSTDNPDHFFEYGKIPIVVAKCGRYLKHNGLSVEGIFRVGGSSKRVKQLQYIFSSPPDYGKKLDWDGYTVHDAASLLRRFLNSMPEPVIPLDQYEAFRAPLKSRHRILKYLAHRGLPAKPTADTTASSLTPHSLTSHSLTPHSLTPHSLTPYSLTPHLHGQQQTSLSILASTGTTSTASNPIVSQGQGLPLVERKKPLLPPRPSERSIADSTFDPSATSELTLEGVSSHADVSPEDEQKRKELEKKRRRRLKKHKRFVEDINGALQEYEKLVQNLPIMRKQLLLYILDLLELFSQHSSENRMSSANLSAVFQPSVLSHPKHDMSPDEYILSQRVVEFLVEYSYKLLPQQTNKGTVSNPMSKSSSLRRPPPTDDSIEPRPVRPAMLAGKIKSVSVDNFYVKSPSASEMPTLPSRDAAQTTKSPLCHSTTAAGVATVASETDDSSSNSIANSQNERFNGISDHSRPTSFSTPTTTATMPTASGTENIPKRGHSKSLSSAGQQSEVLLGSSSNIKNDAKDAKSLADNDAQITTDDESNSDEGEAFKAETTINEEDTFVFTNRHDENDDDDIKRYPNETGDGTFKSEFSKNTLTLDPSDKAGLLSVSNGRTSRWESESASSKDEKKDKWYKRLRSRSRSRSAADSKSEEGTPGLNNSGSNIALSEK